MRFTALLAALVLMFLMIDPTPRPPVSIDPTPRPPVQIDPTPRPPAL